MKKLIFFASLLLFSLSTSMAFAKMSAPNSVPDKKENKISDEEMNRMKNRVEEIRKMDKTNLSTSEKRELKKELKAIEVKERAYYNGGYTGYVYIGGSTIVIIILLLLLL